MSKKRMSKSQRFSREAHLRERRRAARRTKEENEKIEREKIRKREEKMSDSVENIMNAGRRKGVSFKKNGRNISDRTHKNNVSAANAIFKELKIYRIEEINEEKIMKYFEQLREEYEKGDLKKGGYISNKIKAIQRFRESARQTNALSRERKERFFKKTEFVGELKKWRKENKITRSTGGSRYMKPAVEEQKKISDRFRYLRSTKVDDKEIELAYKYHKFASVTSSRLEQGINATSDNFRKISGDRYLYIIEKNQDKAGKARIKIIENKNDVKFIESLLDEARKREKREGHNYLFELRDEKNSMLSRDKMKKAIQDVYSKEFAHINKVEKRKVRGQEKLFEILQNFVPHSSRSIGIQREFKQRALRYKRDGRLFERDLNEMIKYDITKGKFSHDERGAIAFGYDAMKSKLKRGLTIKEKSMYLTSCSVGHNRIDVMRDHYFSSDMNEWCKRKRIE